MFTQNAIDNRWHFSIFTIITDIKGYKTMNELNEREISTIKRILKENDKKVDIKKTYYESGSIEWERPYVNDKIHGVVKGYDKSGVLWWETPYVNGKIHGDEKYYSETGVLRREIPYVNGKKQGVKKEYSESGKLLRTVELL